MKKLSFPKSLVILLIALILTISATGMLGTAADISDDWDDDTNLKVTVLGPRINYRNITQNGDSILHDHQGNVDEFTNVTVNVTHTERIGYLDYVNVTAWFDNGSDANGYNDVSGANYRWKIQYDNTSGTPYWNLTSTHPNDEVRLVPGKRTNNITYQDETTVNWTVTLYWNYQVKHAREDTGTRGVMDTDYSWNVNWTADSSAAPTKANGTVYESNEYGVYKYVYVQSDGEDAVGSGAPGQTINNETDPSLSTNLTIRSNDRYNFSTIINNTFDNSDGSHSIPISNVAINSTGAAGLNLNNFQYFNGLGTPVYLNTSQPHAAYTSGNNATFDTYWQIDIPPGQYADTYSTRITYHIAMDPEFS